MFSHFTSVLTNFSFEGRASRAEYWSFMLFFIPLALLAGASGAVFGETLGTVLYVGLVLATLVQSLALGVRRMHDIDKSGWFVLVGAIPFVGGLIFLVLSCLPGTTGPNNYGQDPHGGHSPATIQGSNKGGWKKVG